MRRLLLALGLKPDLDHIGHALPGDAQPIEKIIDNPVEFALSQHGLIDGSRIGLDQADQLARQDPRIQPAKHRRAPERTVELRIFCEVEFGDNTSRQRPRAQNLHFAVDRGGVGREARHNGLHVDDLRLLAIQKNLRIGGVERRQLEHPDQNQRRQADRDTGNDAKVLS